MLLIQVDIEGLHLVAVGLFLHQLYALDRISDFPATLYTFEGCGSNPKFVIGSKMCPV